MADSNNQTEPKARAVMTKDNIEQYWEEGYTIVRDVFNETDINQMRMSCDRWKAMGLMLERTWRNKNTLIWVSNKVDGRHIDQKTVYGMQWPSYHDATMNQYRTDPRLLELVEPLLGNSLKQIINQIHWKEPESQVSWPTHRDVRTRKPSSAFTDLYTSWVQTGIAIDPQSKENGAMKIVVGSHKDVEHDPENTEIYNIPDAEKDPRSKDVDMNPGDVAMWSAYTIHGGGINSSRLSERRLYINGFVKADKCTRGEWAFKDGRPCPLDKNNQSLVQFEALEELDYGHYPEDLNRVENITD